MKIISFGAGWTTKVNEQIRTCNVDKIADKFDKTGIQTDFKGNKIVAWCCEKTTGVFQHLNEKYRLNLALPKGIFVEDFAKLQVNQQGAGFCNWLPAPVLKNYDKIFPERSLFFDAKFPWENINQFTDDLFKAKFWANNHFLTSFIHENGHVAHNGHLVEINKPQHLPELLEKLAGKKYDAKIGKIVSKISGRATHNPLETIAEDMAGKIAGSLDSHSLLPQKNPFAKSSYPNASILAGINILLKGLQGNKDFLAREALLKKSWNGLV